MLSLPAEPRPRTLRHPRSTPGCRSRRGRGSGRRSVPSPRVEYSLTPTGAALRDFVAELDRWGDAYIRGIESRAVGATAIDH
ncbi:winged helix-turn-helix transcriptional regulator [Nocardia sp. NPDC052254]|uniref:winged helix-turn-helix transcriptional regulator n=1 Tax=Nocardia sp. NPDC052254 TaxID=3155681 RepID=UPI0034121845